MAEELTILVGTAGQGIMRTSDGGESWQRVATNQGMYQNPVPSTGESPCETEGNLRWNGPWNLPKRRHWPELAI